VTSGSTTISYYARSDPQAKVAAKQADLALVFISTTSGEGSDRKSLAYSNEMDRSVSEIASAQNNTIVLGISLLCLDCIASC